MAASFAEKAKVAAITATLVSAAWIVALPIWLERQDASVAASVAPAATAGERPSAGVVQDRDQPTANRGVSSGRLLIPVQGVPASALIDSFGDPRGDNTRSHQAIDIVADRGTPVLAAAAGTIERLYRSDSGGNTLYVRSEDRGTIYYYAHLDGYAPGLAEGRRVARGEPLGTVGSSGNADPAGPHMHFEVLRTTPDAEWWVPATAVNPYPLLTGQRP